MLRSRPAVTSGPELSRLFGRGFLSTNGPGLIAVGIGVALSYALSSAVPAISALTVAVILGALSRNVGILPTRAVPGARFATRTLLRAGVVLLGLQLAISQVLGLNTSVLVVVVATVTVTFAATLWAGRLLGTTPGTTLLVATGFSICGASAAAAMDAVSDSDEEDLATAVALVTLFGGAAIFVLPLLRQPLGLDHTAFGVWSGASVHEVAQVVATASAAGPASVAIATVVKLTRVVLLAPLIAGYSIIKRRRGVRTVSDKRPPVVPLFVVGFVAMVALRSTGLLSPSVLSALKIVTTLLLAGALFGLGTSVHMGSLIRTGGRAIALGAVSTLVAAGISLLCITVLT
ncbi:YeiH family protein [Angustibacter sp. Root456]|uniref:YeiH family protein n=1 Tax=Angustibacter sp. Root456 TaxID=1736539 RepID=UPI0021010AD9|nr:putative sulfate exporter family transporter [Angustibacter sp. Root456]